MYPSLKFDFNTVNILISEIFVLSDSRDLHRLLGRRQANLCFHFAGSGENLPDIAKSRDASMGRKQNSFLFKPQVAIFRLRSSHKLQT